MTFKDLTTRMKTLVLCCGGERKKQSLEISSPTDVRRGVLDMPGLTKEEQDLIREKASTDATGLLSLASHPPSHPFSTPNSRPPSLCSSREPSTTLLNSASANLPTTLPTPPRQKHTDSNPPSSAHSRMKGFWERTRRLSNNLSINSHSGYHDLGKSDDEGVVMLNLDFKDLELDSPISGNSVVEGFEVQDVVGGHEALTATDKKDGNDVIAKAIQDTENGESSGSDTEAEGVAAVLVERKPLARL